MNNLNSKGEVSQACRKIPKLKAYVSIVADSMNESKVVEKKVTDQLAEYMK